MNHRILSIIPALVMIPWLSPLPSQSDTTLVPWEQLDGRQAPAILRTRITLQLDQISFETALQLITRQVDLRLSYNHSQLPLEQLVSLQIQDAPVLDALLSLLEQTGAELLITSQGQLAIVPCNPSEDHPRD